MKVVHGLGVTQYARPSFEHPMPNPVEYPLGTIMFTDVQVTVPPGGVAGEWLRVQGTSGWIYKKDDRSNPKLQELELEVAFSLVKGQEGEESKALKTQFNGALADLAEVRKWANRFNLVEVQHNMTSKVIAFLKRTGPGTEGGGNVRINVYYSTATVGTALAHPKQGHTQLFRRNCTLEDLINIMKNPRVHTTKGYQRNSKRPREADDKDVHRGASPTRSTELSDRSDDNDERALRLSLQAFDEEAEELAKTRASIVERLMVYQDTRVKRSQAVVDQIRQKTAQDEAKARQKIAQMAAEKAQQEKLAQQKKAQQEKLAQQRAAEKRQQEEAAAQARAEWERQEAIALEQRKRGDRFRWLLADKNIHLDAYTEGIALGYVEGEYDERHDSVLAYNGQDTWWNGLPDELDTKLRSRAPHHPPLVEATLGAEGQYFVRFANGTSKWYFADDELNDLASTHGLDWVALGVGEEWCGPEHNYVAAYQGYITWSVKDSFPEDLLDILQNSSNDIHRVTMGPSGEWFVSFQSGSIEWGGCGDYVNDVLRGLVDNGWYVRHIEWGADDSHIIRYSDYSGPF